MPRLFIFNMVGWTLLMMRASIPHDALCVYYRASRDYHSLETETKFVQPGKIFEVTLFCICRIFARRQMVAYTVEAFIREQLPDERNKHHDVKLSSNSPKCDFYLLGVTMRVRGFFC